MARKAGIGTELSKLAALIAKEAQADNVELADRIDAFKSLTVYHIGVTKAKMKEEPEDDTPNFGSFSANIAKLGGKK